MRRQREERESEEDTDEEDTDEESDEEGRYIQPHNRVEISERDKAIQQIPNAYLRTPHDSIIKQLDIAVSKAGNWCLDKMMVLANKAFGMEKSFYKRCYLLHLLNQSVNYGCDRRY